MIKLQRRCSTAIVCLSIFITLLGFPPLPNAAAAEPFVAVDPEAQAAGFDRSAI